MLIQNDDAAPGNNQGGGYAKTLFSLGIVSFLIKIAGRISKYLMILLISRYIGVDALGLFVLCITIMSMLSVVSMMGLNTLLLKYVAEFTTKQQFDLARLAYKRAVSLACPMGIAVSLGLYTCSPFVASTIFGKPAMEPYLEIISMGILPFILLNLSFQSLRGMRRI